MRAALLVLIVELALLLVALFVDASAGPEVIEVVVTATPALPLTPTPPSMADCYAQGQGWYWCP